MLVVYTQLKFVGWSYLDNIGFTWFLALVSVINSKAIQATYAGKRFIIFLTILNIRDAFTILQAKACITSRTKAKLSELDTSDG